MTQREQDRLDFPSIPALLMDYDEAACSHMSSSIQVYTSFSVCSVNLQRPSTIKQKSIHYDYFCISNSFVYHKSQVRHKKGIENDQKSSRSPFLVSFFVQKRRNVRKHTIQPFLFLVALYIVS